MTRADFAEMLKTWTLRWDSEHGRTIWESPDDTVKIGLKWWGLRDIPCSPTRRARQVEIIYALSRVERRALRKAMRAESARRDDEARAKYASKARKHIEIMAGTAPKQQMVDHMLTEQPSTEHDAFQGNCEIGFGG